MYLCVLLQTWAWHFCPSFQAVSLLPARVAHPPHIACVARVQCIVLTETAH